MEKTQITLQRAAQVALEVQDASNLSGVAKYLAGPVMDALCEETRKPGSARGTDWLNQHPIVTLFIDKLASLNRSQFNPLAVSEAYAKVEAIAQGREV